MWLLYEHPEVNFSDLREKYLDVRKRAFKFPTLGDLAKLVCIPTTSGTGAEITPFAVISDPETGYKYPLADYALTPTVAIVDPNLTERMPAFVAADSGMDALTHATEAFVSVYANDFTDGMALHAIKLIFGNIEKSVLHNDPKARETMHNAATIAGMAFGNAFLGIVHAMSHTVGSTFKQIHGRTNAVFLPYAIRYNGQIPTKFNAWPKYETYTAPERYQWIAKELGLPASTPEEGVESYAQACSDLRARLGMPGSFKEMGIDEGVFMGSLDALALRSFEDQCAPANPRMPMLADMKELMEAAYYGITREQVRAARADIAKTADDRQAEAPAEAPAEAEAGQEATAG
jgi:acetaldehyde dehydrogenase/alcohol dehydrogenase